MKKNYLKPEMEVTKVEVESLLASLSQEPGTPGIDGPAEDDEF